MTTPIRMILASLGVVLATGCASSGAPRDLVEARAAYRDASEGPAAQLAPSELMDARQALTRAEKSYKDDGASRTTKDLSYIATRRAEIASAVAERRRAEEDRAQADKQRGEVSEQLRQATVTELRKTKAELGREEEKRADAENKRAEAEEKQRVAEAEREQAKMDAAAARAALEQWAQLVETERGLIITMSSGVLFATGRSEVLPEAGMKLQTMANFLRASPGRKILIEGHTDSAGSDAYNQTLSQARAESVRAFLALQGVPADRMTAIGYGEARPVATNATIEGRANNRRVEIVLEPVVVLVP